MTTIYLVRHGENLANITRELSYKHIDYELTNKGHFQAAQTATAFDNITIDAIYSSPLKRAMQTAEYIAKRKKLIPKILENFREINMGKVEGMKPNEESWKQYFLITHKWYMGEEDISFPEGENYSQLVNRFATGLLEAIKKTLHGNIAVIGHAGIFAAGVIHLCKIENKKEFSAIQNHNCSISELSVTQNNQNLSYSLVKWADSSHLTGSAAKLVKGMPESSS